MAFSNFKKTIWSKYIQTELEKKCKLVEDCWTQFEGEAKQGARVKILGVAAPTVKDYDRTNGLGTPENPQDTSTHLDIDQAKVFNFMVDDVDKAQGAEGVMQVLMTEAIRKMAQARDSYVASLAANAPAASASTKIDTATKAKTAVDAALLALRENDVDVDDDVVITVSPFFYQLFRDALTEFKTDNDQLIAKGVVGMYDGCKVKMSNNLYNDGTDDYMFVRTRRAVAFASGIDEVEAYRPENFFSDAVKGLNVYGARIIRPKELYVIKAHK